MQDQNYALFEAYITNTLSEEDRLKFEAQLKTDTELKQYFIDYKDAYSFLENKFENENLSTDFKNNLSTISEAYFKKHRKTKRSSFYKYTLAACVIALLGVFILNHFTKPTYENYSTFNSISLSVRGEGNTLLKTAENAFNNRDFKTANKTFQDLLKTDSSNLEYKLYSAICNIELNQFKTAENILESLINQNSVYKNTASWYLALSKLKQKQYKTCKDILKTIPKEADHYKQAQKLIKKLD